MKVLLLGVGMQGKAALHDLMQSKAVAQVIAADRDLSALNAHVAGMRYGSKVRCEEYDAADPQATDRLMQQGGDVIIDLLPKSFGGSVAAAAVRHGIHLVNASYCTPEVKALSDEAAARAVTILPEFGMDPGMDLVLLGEAIRLFDSVEDVISYGAGFPEPAAADNALKYKVTWTFVGVLQSYWRAARIIRDGRVVEIKESDMFAPENCYEMDIEGLGRLEAFANGDALKYADLLGLERSSLRNMGRYVLRWPGHCAFWKAMADLHLLDDEPVTVGSARVDRKRFLAAAIEPHIHYKDDERDVVVVRIEVRGTNNGKRKQAIYQVIDWRDLATGFTAMSRTVGYTASIGAQMIATGAISNHGVLSPLKDVPYETFVRELSRRGIQVTAECAFCE